MSICQAQERPAEVRTAADDSRDNCRQEAAEWRLGPVSRDRQDLEPLFPGSDGGGLDLREEARLSTSESERLGLGPGLWV